MGWNCLLLEYPLAIQVIRAAILQADIQNRSARHSLGQILGELHISGFVGDNFAHLVPGFIEIFPHFDEERP